MNLDVTCILLLLNTLNKKVSQIYFFQFVSLLIAHSQHRFPAACVVTNVMTCKYGHHTIDRLEEREA